MHPELEALIRLYDDALEAIPDESATHTELFEKKLFDFISRTPGVREETSRNLICREHGRWLVK